jgi:hypothetical protein
MIMIFVLLKQLSLPNQFKTKIYPCYEEIIWATGYYRNDCLLFRS